MADNNDTFCAFNFDFSDQIKINKRVGVRYPAPAAKLTLVKKNLFNFSGEFSGKLIDISPKGALISCSEQLSDKTKLALTILFADGSLFNLTGQVVREKSLHHYGIKFDAYNQHLDEYLFNINKHITHA